MATQSFEFILGTIFLAEGAISMVLRFIILRTRFGHVLRECEMEIHDTMPVVPRLSDMLLAMGVLSLVAGTALAIIAFIAYAGL